MMITELITPTTVVKAAQFILALGLSAMQEKHYLDLNAARYWLQAMRQDVEEARDRYALTGAAGNASYRRAI